jgi:uncharacterized membrane protein YhaH (DUF805 family)
MNFWHLLFSFDGRIRRKTYIIAVTVLTLSMFALMHTAAALVTGDPLSSALWGYRPENIGVWGPIYGGVTLLTVWPALALMTKRLHDRNYPMWIGLAFYLGVLTATAALFWLGLVNSDVADAQKPSQGYILIAMLVLWPAAIWFTAQVMFMRGVVGPNAYGLDPLAGHPLPGHEPRTFWNVVFNPDGRMSRKMWWLMFVSLVVLFVIWGAIFGIALYSAISSLPQDADPAWLGTPEGQQAMSRAILPAVIPLTLVLYLLIWPAFAAGTKRLHDRGRSGWVLALYYVPFALFAIAASMLPTSVHDGAVSGSVGRWLMIAAGVICAGLSLWLLVELGFLKGQSGENAYGPDTRKA